MMEVGLDPIQYRCTSCTHLSYSSIHKDNSEKRRQRFQILNGVLKRVRVKQQKLNLTSELISFLPKPVFEYQFVSTATAVFDQFVNNILKSEWFGCIIIFLTLEDIADCYAAFTKPNKILFCKHLQEFVVIAMTKNEKLQRFLFGKQMASTSSIINYGIISSSKYILVPKHIWNMDIFAENGYLKYFYYTRSRRRDNNNLYARLGRIGWDEYTQWKIGRDSSVSLQNFSHTFNRTYIDITFGSSICVDRNCCWWRSVAYHVFSDEDRYVDIKHINILFLTLSELQFVTLFGVNKLYERQHLLQFLIEYGLLEETLEKLQQDDQLFGNFWVELLMYAIIWPTFTFCLLYTDTDSRKSLKCAIDEKSNGYNVGLHFDNSSESSTLDIIYTLFTRIYKGTDICQQQLDHWNHFNVNDCSHVSFIILHEEHFFPLSHRIN